MFLGKDVIGNPIINVRNGRKIGRVRDLYLDHDLQRVVGLYVGSEGLLRPTPRWIAANDIAVVSEDTVLARGDIIVTTDLDKEMQPWLRRDDLQGRTVDTMGGTKIGRIGDVILDEKAAVVGFSLDRVYVQGPVAERRALRRTAVHDIGHEDGNMTINLREVEEQNLQVVNTAFFGEELMVDIDSDEGKSPYTESHPPSAYTSHADISPYVPGPEAEVDETYKSPYTTPELAPPESEPETYKSPYTTPEQ